MATVQDMLGEYFAGQSQWRLIKADEYPDDVRNVESAAALRDLAAYVRNAPDDHRWIEKLAALVDAQRADVWMPGEEAARLASRFGFDHEGDSQEELDFDVFLMEFYEAEVGTEGRRLADDVEDSLGSG